MHKPGWAVAVAATVCLSLAACDSEAPDGGTDGAEIVVSSDLPLTGAAQAVSESTNNMIRVYLDRIDNRAGQHRITFTTYDNSSGSADATDTWDEQRCAENAAAHLAEPREVAVMGTYNSECTKIELPLLNDDPGGPMLMVSHANTNPGLTTAWGSGEPDTYYPGGSRSFARVITSDDAQAAAAARFAQERLGVKKAFVLHDGQDYGRGLAETFRTEAGKVGIEVAGEQVWDGTQADYTSLFTAAKKLAPDMVYLAGIYENNGAQLITDKVAVLGDNTAVKLIAPDGFAGYPDLQALSQGEGMYLTFSGLSPDQLLAEGGITEELLEAYREAHDADPVSSLPFYGAAAMQVIVAAIEASDGTREGVLDAVFEGDGITVPAQESAIGRQLRIDPATGDTTDREVSILKLTDGVETLVQSQSAS